MHKKPTKRNIKLGKGGAKRQVIRKGKKEREVYVMFDWCKRKENIIEKLLTVLLRQGEYIMATLVEVQAQSVALQEAFTAEQQRQAAKNATLQSTIDAQVNALAAIQVELDALKGGGQTPENQAIIDDISNRVASVVTGLNASAV